MLKISLSSLSHLFSRVFISTRTFQCCIGLGTSKKRPSVLLSLLLVPGAGDESMCLKKIMKLEYMYINY